VQTQSRMKSWREGPVNCFLLCTILAKQTRRLERLMPDRRIPELITIALKNCADYELALDVDAGIPEVVRKEAMQIGRVTRRPAVASGPEPWQGRQLADAVPTSSVQDTTEGEPTGKTSRRGEGAIDIHLPASSPVDSLVFHPNLRSIQRKHSMSNSNGVDVDPIQLRQLRAMAENLCIQANHHRENQNYLVAYGLYGRALSIAQTIPTSDHNENALVARIRTDQQAVFEILGSAESGLKATPLEKAQKVGR
jgi:hypothetical protein